MATIFDRIAGEWPVLARSPEATAALARWTAAEPVLARFPTLFDIESFARRGAHGAVDRMLLALVRRAADDPLAAQVVLHLLLPGCRAMARRLAWVDRDRGEVAAAVVAAVYDRTRRYPTQRRPRLVALNILLDAAKDVRRLRDANSVVLDADLDAHAADRVHVSASDELAGLLRAAVREQVLDPRQARLVAAIRLCDVRTDEIARVEGCHPGSVRRRRHAAEQRLAALAA